MARGDVMTIVASIWGLKLLDRFLQSSCKHKVGTCDFFISLLLVNFVKCAKMQFLVTRVRFLATMAINQMHNIIVMDRA